MYWKDDIELTLFRAASLSGKYLCVAQDITRKKEYKNPVIECCSINQEALN